MRPYDEVPEDEGPSSVFKCFAQGEGYEGIRPEHSTTLRRALAVEFKTGPEAATKASLSGAA